MGRVRTPWWAYLLILSFGSFFLFYSYLQLFPLSLKVYLDVEPGARVVHAVVPGGPAAAAGMRAGDRIVTYNGRRFQDQSDQLAFARSYEAGQTLALEIERDHQRFTVTPVPQRSFLFASADTGALLAGYGRLALTFYLGCGIFLLLVRPHDRVVLVLAVSCLIVADFGWPILAGFGAAFRALPAVLQIFFWIPLVVESTLMGFLGCWFALNFPRPYLSKRWIWWLVAPSLVFAPARLLGTYRLIYDPTVAAPILFSTTWRGGRIELMLLVAVETTFFVLSYLHVQDANERRRVRLVILAVLLILGSGVICLAPVLFFPNSIAAAWVMSAAGLLVLFSAFAAAPVIISYALIRHRLFDIRVMIRQGLRYAAARGVLLGIVPLAVVLLGADIALQSRQPLVEIIQKHGWAYAIVAVLALMAHVMRKQWMDALDRRFFREGYNVHQILREVAEEIHNARQLEAAAPRTVARIESALHSSFVALMVREPEEISYSPQAIAPSGVSVPKLLADSKLMGAFRLFAKPLDTSSSQNAWLQQQLPHAETEFLRQAEIELMVPVSLGAGGREALLALGRKKSEEPYSSEDQELLLAIASSLALLLERPSAAVSRASGLGQCPRCGACYESGIGACTEDGAQLTLSPVPRLLGSRYRLDRKLGQGGMGTVYSAFDTSLERQVALKLIREDLVSNAEAADRFRREAKAAAAITHRNIVVLHDFAIDAGNRAFLVMELLAGSTARQRLQEHGRLAQDSLLDLLRGVCSALTVAHQRGLIHRDLKPENIFMVDDNGRDLPKVLDFGLAKFVAANDGMTQLTMDTGALVGTPHYMSPEQLNGLAVSAAWDLWALTVIAYEMLIGNHPFGNPTSVGALHNAILASRFTPVPADLPHAIEWQEFFVRSFHPDPARRPASAGEFIAACETRCQVGMGG
jgi:tRNA A-37 threonylcarbamoyl transferase component Bud32